jgi:hypothetical protein
MSQSTMRPSGGSTTPKVAHDLITVSLNQLITQSGNTIQASK